MAELTFSHDGRAHALRDRAGIIDALAGLLPEDLRQAFADAGNGLDDFLDEKRDELALRLPENARFLITRLKEFDERSFELAELMEKQSGESGKLAVGAAATVLLDRLEPDQLQGDVGFELDDEHALLKLQLTGELDGSAELKGSSGILTVGFNFAAGTKHTLGYYFAADRRSYVATVLPRLKDLVVDPSSLAAVLDALDAHGLVRVERTGGSTMKLGLTIGISRQIGEMIRGAAAVGSVGGVLSLEYHDQAVFSLIVDRAADGYVIDFRKTRRKSHSRVLNLGVDVRIVGFKNRLVEQIARAIPEDTALTGLLERLDAMTENLSREALGTELERALADQWPDGQRVIGFLIGNETAKQLADEILGELQDKIEETINAEVDLLNANAGTAALMVAGRISEALGLTDEALRSQLEAYVSGAVEAALKAFEGGVDSAVSRLIGAGDVAALLTPWEFVGDTVSNALDALSNNAADAVERTRAALAKVHERYTRFRQSVLTAVRQKMEEELSISIISEKERTLTNTRAVRYRFHRREPAVEKLYKALWTGDLRDFRTLVEPLDDGNLDGEYVSVETRLRSAALNFNFFGLEFGATEVFSDTVEVGIDLNGQLIVAKSKAELEKRRRRGGESQVINAVWQVDYLRSTVLDAPLFIKVVLTDDDFESGDEAEEFFGPLERIGAMRSGISDDVETTLFSSTVKAVRGATLTINVMLRWQEWLELVGLDLEARPVPNAWQPDAVGRQFLQDSEMLVPVYASAARKLMRKRPGEFADLPAFLLKFGAIRSPRRAARFVGEEHRSQLFRTGWRLARVVANLHSGLIALQANWQMLVANLPDFEASDGSEPETLRRDMQAVNNAFARAFGPTLSTGLRFDDPGKSSWLLASTLNLFRSVSELPNPYLSCTFQSDRTGRLLFS